MLASELISILPQNDSAHVLALHGDLGAGKTTFVQKLAEELGVVEAVTSPTFVVMKQYEIAEPTSHMTHFVHIDAYRIDDVAELDVLRIPELFQQPHTIVCIEWAEKITERLPDKYIDMTFTIELGTQTRNVQVGGIE